MPQGSALPVLVASRMYVTKWTTNNPSFNLTKVINKVFTTYLLGFLVSFQIMFTLKKLLLLKVLYSQVPPVISSIFGEYNEIDVYLNFLCLLGFLLKLGNLVYLPPTNGPKLWRIGYSDRTAIEFYIPEANSLFVNKHYTDSNVNP